MPSAPNPATGEYDCPIRRPVGFGLIAVAAAVGAVGAFEARAPQTCDSQQFWDGSTCSPRWDMYGYPNCGLPLQHSCDPTSPDYRWAKWPLLALASLATVAAVTSWSEYGHCTRLDPSKAPKPVEPAKDERREEVSGLARDAMSRMDAGDCDGVRSIAERVRALDAVYYARVFLPVFGACIQR